MKLIIEVKPASDDEGNEMTTFHFRHKGKPESMAVMRGIARMSRAVGMEYTNLLAETDFIDLKLENEDK
jgi:hypothetical protein